MTENSQEFKNGNENGLGDEDMKRAKKNQSDESLNTKNFIRKMTLKKGELDQKAQPKITAYMSISNSTSYGLQKDQLNNSSLILNSNDPRVRQIEERMKQKDLEIQKMKRAREIDQNRYSILFMQNRQNKKKTRQAIAKSMLQASQYRRTEKRQINPKLGYFKEGLRVFIEGSILTNLRQKIRQKHDVLKQLQDQKKSKDHQKKERAIFKSQFIQKELSGLHKQVQNTENYVNIYKQKLKLADKEANCQYALKGWPIVFDQYQSLQLLGKGGFGQVYKCYDLENNEIIALKVNHFNQDPAHQDEFIKHVYRQADIMKKMNHPNVGKFLKLLQCSSNRVTFALQYCSGPELSNYLKKYICLQEKEAKQIVRQIFAAIYYFSSLKEKIIHYDLKPSNIMFHNGLVKILDFGLCKPMGNQQSRIQLTSQGVGTYWYLPPQTFNQSYPQITPKVDIWSAGVIFFEMLYGKKPFGHGISQDKIYNQGIILNAKKVDFPLETPKKYRVSEATKNFIRSCLTYSPQQRLSPSQAYEHQYFKK